MDSGYSLNNRSCGEAPVVGTPAGAGTSATGAGTSAAGAETSATSRLMLKAREGDTTNGQRCGTATATSSGAKGEGIAPLAAMFRPTA